MKRIPLLRVFTAVVMLSISVGMFQPVERAHASAANPILTVNDNADVNLSDAGLTLREAILISNGGTSVSGLNRPLSTDEQLQAPDCLFDIDGNITGQCGAGISETMEFAFASDTTITLASLLPVIADGGFGLTISGPTSVGVTISGAHSFRIFEVTSAASLSISNLTIANGSGNGAGIFNSGTLTLQNSTIKNNDGLDPGFGGGLYNNGGTATITNSTFTGNDAADGGAIYNTGGVIHLYSSTLYNNALYGQSSVRNDSSTITIKNTIIASSGSSDSCSGYPLEAASLNNIADDTSCGASFAQKTLGEIALDTLADNGGPTQTFALLTGSHALNTGNDTACPTTDQRGVSRPKGTHCDIGSFEMDVSSLTLDPASIVFDNQPIGTASPPRVVTVTNNAANDLSIAVLLVTGDFIMSDDTCSLATLSTGETCTFEVAFRPVSAVARTGKVSVPSDSPTSPDELALSGLGIYGKQLLRDPGFDTISRWPLVWRAGSRGYSIASVRDCTVSLTLLCSVRFWGTEFENRVMSLSQWVYVPKSGMAGDRYFVSLSSRAEDVPVGGQYKLVVDFLDARRKVIASQTLEFAPGTHDFETLSAYIIIPVRHASIHFSFFYQNPSGTVWFDAAALMEIP